jgi:hypothetical protein
MPFGSEVHGFAVIEVLRRTEDSAHVGISLEERKEDDDALDDGGLDLRTKELPVLPIPILDAVETVAVFLSIRLTEENVEGFVDDFRWVKGNSKLIR